MSKKKTPRKVKVTSPPRVRHVHYFYVILAVIGLGTTIAVCSLPLQRNSVLGAKAGRASSSADAGKVDIRMTGDDRSTFTEIHSEAEPGEEIERDDQSGGSNGGKDDKRGKRFRVKAERLREKADIRNGKGDKARRDKKNKGKRNRIASGEANLLPDQAIETLLEKGVIGGAKGDITGETTTGQNGEELYVIQGATQKKVLGLFPVTIEKKVTVSAENGEVEKTDMSFIDRILNTFSF